MKINSICGALMVATALIPTMVDLHAQTGVTAQSMHPNIAAPGAPANPGIPSGIIPAQCKPLLGSDEVLDCYLKDPANFNIALSIDWYTVVNGQGIASTYSGWTPNAKAQLRQTFHDTVAWYNGGMTNYPGILAADPPPNPAEAAYRHGLMDRPVIGGDMAWKIYLEHVSLILASEIYGWVPWGLHNYEWLSVVTLLSSSQMFEASGQDYPGTYRPFRYATPGNAINSLKFLKSNNLVGATKADTIARVLEWSRKNLKHFNGPFTPQNQHDIWQYYGNPPVSRVISKTTDLNPLHAFPADATQHWTAGCFGTSAFMFWIFKAVNIPVGVVSVGYHTAPSFPSEKQYLSHGDDPYEALSQTNFPASLLLIDEPTYQTWFPANDHDAGNLNVGRRPLELAVQYPTSTWITSRYCDDLAKGRDHASSRVYNEVFSPLQVQANGPPVATFGYTVAYLEAAGLWTKLDSLPVCAY